VNTNKALNIFFVYKTPFFLEKIGLKSKHEKWLKHYFPGKIKQLLINPFCFRENLFKTPVCRECNYDTFNFLKHLSQCLLKIKKKIAENLSFFFKLSTVALNIQIYSVSLSEIF
jgi:hypothetical protein